MKRWKDLNNEERAAVREYYSTYEHYRKERYTFKRNENDELEVKSASFNHSKLASLFQI